MFEFEAAESQSKADLDEPQKRLFRDDDAEIEAVSLTSWEEHCTECAMPACFATCDLYEARVDGRCRRFVDDMALVEGVPTPQGYAVRVEFKRWAQLMAYANANLIPLGRARALERLSLRADRIVSQLPGRRVSILGVTNVAQKAERKLKRWLGCQGLFSDKAKLPDYFVLEVHNPDSKSVRLSLTIHDPDGIRAQFRFQAMLTVEPGFNRFKIDCAEISSLVDLRAELHIALTPNILRKEDEGLTLYFGAIGFVADAAYRRSRAGGVAESPVANGREKTAKVVIWDLDNTVWDGVLVEDGPERLRLHPKIADIMAELDRRGIVNSVVSKNDHAYAMDQLERFGLAEYVVFPRISWEPKGAAVAAVITDFNVGSDTVVFVDDQPFEREQVRQTVPGVRTIDATDIGDLLSLDIMSPEQSHESGRRREFYLNQKTRRTAETGHSGDYEEFLRDCKIRLGISTRGAAKADRVHELVQRTNQMNFSGSRYTRDEIDQILYDERFDHFVVTSADKFGDYGVIGFGLVEKEIPRLVDLMFSCRIQSKRVEHAFLSYLLRLYRDAGCVRFEARFRRTDRNEAAGKVFEDLRFEESGTLSGVTSYQYDLAREIPDDRIIRVAVES